MKKSVVVLIAPTAAASAALDLADGHGLTAQHFIDAIWLLRGSADQVDGFRKSVEAVVDAEYLVSSYEFVGDNADSWEEALKPDSLPEWSGDLRNPYIVFIDTYSDDVTQSSWLRSSPRSKSSSR